MEMDILKYYAARADVSILRTRGFVCELILVANGPVNHRGGAVSRRLRDALYELTALCQAHPRAKLLTLLADEGQPPPHLTQPTHRAQQPLHTQPTQQAQHVQPAQVTQPAQQAQQPLVAQHAQHLAESSQPGTAWMPAG